MCGQLACVFRSEKLLAPLQIFLRSDFRPAGSPSSASPLLQVCLKSPIDFHLFIFGLFLPFFPGTCQISPEQTSGLPLLKALDFNPGAGSRS